MKIAIIVNSLLVSGGTERQAICLARELRDMGHNIRLYAFSLNRAECFPEILRDFPVTLCDADWPKFFQKFYGLNFIGPIFHKLRDSYRARKMAALIDLDTEVLNPHEQMAARVVYYFKKRGGRFGSVLMINDLFLAGWSMYDDPAFKPKRRSFSRRFFSAIKDHRENRKFGKPIDILAVLNNRTREVIRFRLRRGAAVVRSGIDVSEFSYKERAIERKTVKLLCHGIFFPHRRFEDAIRALRLLRDEGINATLTIVGDHDHKATARAYFLELEKIIAELDLGGSVFFEGVVSGNRLRELYEQSHILIFSSHLQTWGLAVFEALASGLPVILSRSTGAAEVLTDYENVLLSNPLSPASIRDRVKELISDPELYVSISKNGRKFVEENLSWRKYAEAMAELFQIAANKK